MVRVEVTDYRTDKGEQRTVNLGDGSTVMLSTDTALSVELSGRRRTVVLQRGEALFSVRHETDRPFAVLAANGTVRDIGTRFTVYRSSDRVRVAVVEGVVEVQTQSTEQSNQVAEQASRAARAESATQAGERTVLTEGDRVWYGSDGRLTAVQKVDRELITAAFHRKLVFDAVPLARVIEEVSRYRDGEIRILDPTLSSLQISGVFHQDNLDGLWKALEHALPVTVTSVHPNLVILERTQGRQPIPLRPVTEKSAAGENL
jgi:transmembrane sensor